MILSVLDNFGAVAQCSVFGSFGLPVAVDALLTQQSDNILAPIFSSP